MVYGAITFLQSGVFGVCLDIGQAHAGAMVGLMNTASQVGGLLGSLAYGYIVDRSGSFDAPFYSNGGVIPGRCAVAEDRCVERGEGGGSG